MSKLENRSTRDKRKIKTLAFLRILCIFRFSDVICTNATFESVCVSLECLPSIFKYSDKESNFVWMKTTRLMSYGSCSKVSIKAVYSLLNI